MTTKICTLFVCSGLILLGVAGCTITTEGIQEAEVPTSEIFPPSKAVASYRQLEKPKKLSDDEVAIQYGGSQKMGSLEKWTPISTLSADYGIPERPPVARVSITEMGTKQNAYGAYTNIRPGLLNEDSYLKIGVHATVDGDTLLFVQDRFLVVIRQLGVAEDPARRTMLINFARVISDRIPRDITDINLVNYLPYENRVPATERLDKEDPLGMGLFKNGGVTALYRIENRECKVFLADAKDASGTKGLMNGIKAAMEKEGPIKELGVGTEGYQGRLFKSQAMAGRRESVMFGCYGTFTEKEMRNVVAAIDRRVKPATAPKPAAKATKKADPEAHGPHAGSD